MPLKAYFISNFVKIYLLNYRLLQLFSFTQGLRFSRLSIYKTEKFARIKTSSKWLAGAGLIVLNLL
jgi:hypothetical protein